jgi:putative transposase
MLTIILRAAISVFRSREALVLENLALRHQIQVLQRTGKRRPRLSRLDRGLWAFLSRVWSGWRDALVIVKPETVVRWHSQGFRLYWRRKSQVLGRPRKPRNVRDLVRRIARENPIWGAPRIHGEMLKLGIDIGPTTVASYMPRTRRPPSQSWRTFLRNHAHEIAAIDFFTVPTATFKILYVFLVLSHDRRRVLHFNVTNSPTAAWTALQILQAFPWDTAPQFILRDRDAIYGKEVQRTVRNLGIKDVPTAPRSPWQNGSIRCECLDHVIVLNEMHLRRVLREYFTYYEESRTHLGLAKDCPQPREVEPANTGSIIAIPQVGGLHHRYKRRAA